MVVDHKDVELSQYGLSLPIIEKSKYCEKLASVNSRQCFFMVHSQYWTGKKAELKALVKQTDRNHLYFYLVYKECKLDGKPIESVKSIESYRRFKDGHLRDYSAMKLPGGFVVVKGLVTRSYGYSLPPRNCWVVYEHHGAIKCGHCDCPAGLNGTCSHVGVVLWGVVNLAEETCTQDLQKWHDKNPGKHPELSTTILSLQTSQNTKREYGYQYDSISEETRHNLLESLAKEQAVSLHRVVHPFLETLVPRQFRTPLPPRMTSFYNKSLISLSLDEIEACSEDFINRYDVTTEQRDLVEELTRGQSTCVEWHYHREGRVTGSNCYAVSRTNLEKPAKSLVQKIVYPVECKFRSDATEWGIKHESVAMETLRTHIIERGVHPGFKIEKTGFLISRRHGYLGASPDGILKCSCCGSTIIEVKCPYSHRNETLWEAATNDSQFCLSAGEDGRLSLKNDHPYFYQVQLQLFVCEVNKGLFCVYTSKDFACIEVAYDEEFVFEQIIPKAKLYVMKVV